MRANESGSLFGNLPAPEGGVARLRRGVAAREQRRRRRRRLAYALGPAGCALVAALSLRIATPTERTQAGVASTPALDASQHPMLALAAEGRFVGASLLVEDPQRVLTSVPTRSGSVTLYLHDTR